MYYSFFKFLKFCVKINIKPLLSIIYICLPLLMNGCSLSLPKFGSDDTKEVSSGLDYEQVLSKTFAGYNVEANKNEINNGAENFAKCANATECALLWDTAKTWLTEKSNFKGKLKTNTKNLLETIADPRKSKANKITFKVTRMPGNKINFIKIEANCLKNCTRHIDKEYYAFNNFLRTHLVAYKEGIIGYEKVNDEIFFEASGSDEMNIDFDDMSDKSQKSVLKENELSNKIEITKIKKKKYIGKVAETLIDDYSCNKKSEINLVKKTNKRELYEVNCIKEIKRMIFDCDSNGCEVLQ